MRDTTTDPVSYAELTYRTDDPMAAYMRRTFRTMPLAQQWANRHPELVIVDGTWWVHGTCRYAVTCSAPAVSIVDMGPVGDVPICADHVGFLARIAS